MLQMLQIMFFGSFPIDVPGKNNKKMDSCFSNLKRRQLWSPKHKAWCCWKQNIACPTHVPRSEDRNGLRMGTLW